MCIALISTAHPSYPLILIDNRDEYLNRPTDRARWWPTPNQDVLGGRDMLRDIHGTWLGVTKAGKIAVLTNYREYSNQPVGAVSRGAIMRKFLSEDVGPVDRFVKEVVNTGIAKDAGGFSLVCGRVGEKLAVISNRAHDQSQVPWIAGDTVHTVGLSNAAFLDRSWTKVTLGEELMLNSIRASIENHDTEDQLIQRFLQVLSHNTLPQIDEHEHHGGLETYIPVLRNTIFVPPLGCKDSPAPADDVVRAAKPVERVDLIGHNTPIRQESPIPGPSNEPALLGASGLYGTQKQTVVLFDKESHVRFFERTLYDENSDPIPVGEGDIDIKFRVEK
ncbi:uncharacterized protein A1O9_03613 [Exophiala aquamarina CBS 119918]|uniref:Ser/Thr-rich protein T10 in DGCR region n=1 Tax=Exophiala aquamarina CBS 119918 TaxID=1182545 RepID=A0A072PTG2_9EURO|nr:uncharacterized protein A1O9_03613 [Exophiala aquamarina CBS 119918]KEF58770.1 hypothetical protein A1O9_03613 [Exophiala aquamarina CBS 119918]